MKTLKKTLCLVLAVVMVVGVLIIPANAADFDDLKEAEQSEAVKVLNYLEIMTGVEDNKFDPEGNVTRAQAATLVVRMLEGRVMADAIPGGVSFDDVDATYYDWAIGSISYAKQLGIIGGYEDGTFKPEGSVTGFELAKMLLIAIGAAQPGAYDGANYEIKVLLDGSKADVNLFAGIEKFDGSKALTRADAAQMIFNALNYGATDDSKNYVVVDKNHNVKGTYTEFFEAYLAADAHNKADVENSDPWSVETQNNKKGSLIGDKHGLTVSTYTDDFQRTSKSWKKNGKDVVVLNFEANLKYTGLVPVTEILTDMGVTNTTTKVTLNVYEDGGTATQKVDQQNKNDNTETVGGAGAVVQVQVTGNTTADVFVINTYAYQLKKGDITPAKAAVPGVSEAVKASIKVPSSENYDAGTTASLVINTGDFGEGDVVLYNISKNGTEHALNVVKAAVAETGKVSRIESDGTVTINNNKYISSAKVPTATKTKLTAIDNKAYVFYKDHQDNLIYAAEPATTNDPETKVNYIYVYGWAAKAAGNEGGTDLFGTGSISTDAKVQARVLYLDTGLTDVVDVAITKTAAGDWVLVNPDGTASSTKIDSAYVAGLSSWDKEGIHAFTVRSDGSYAIAAEKTESTTGLTGKLSLKRNTVDTGVTVTEGSKKLLVNSSTELVVATLSKTGNVITGADVLSYIGMAQFPNNAVEIDNVASLGTTICVIDQKDGIASRIVIVFAAPDESEDVNFAVYLGKGGKILSGDGEAPEAQLYKFLINGEVVELADEVVKPGQQSTNSSTLVDSNKGKVYDLTIDNGAIKGKIGDEKAKVTIDGTSDTTTIVTVDPAYIVVGDKNDIVTLASDCVFVLKSGDVYTVIDGIDAAAQKISAIYTDGTATTKTNAHLIIVEAKS